MHLCKTEITHRQSHFHSSSSLFITTTNPPHPNRKPKPIKGFNSSKEEEGGGGGEGVGCLGGWCGGEHLQSLHNSDHPLSPLHNTSPIHGFLLYKGTHLAKTLSPSRSIPTSSLTLYQFSLQLPRPIAEAPGQNQLRP